MKVQKGSNNTAPPVGVVVTADDGGVGKTTVAVQLVTGFRLAGLPLDLYQMDSKGKLAAKSGETVTSLLVSDRQASRGEDLTASDVIAPWYRAATAMPETRRSTLLEVGGAMASLFHAGIVDVDLAEDIEALDLTIVPFVVCKAGEDSAAQLLREIGRLERNLPNARPVIVLNEVVGKPIAAAEYLADDVRKPFAAVLKKYPVIRMPKVRPRSMAIYERMHALPSEIVCWHAENYSEAIRRTGRPRDEAKIFVKDVAEWSGLMQEQIERVLPFLGGAPHD
jgi:cellulose biosynthesis protein BcsQ